MMDVKRVDVEVPADEVDFYSDPRARAMMAQIIEATERAGSAGLIGILVGAISGALVMTVILLVAGAVL